MARDRKAELTPAEISRVHLIVKDNAKIITAGVFTLTEA